MGHKKRKNRKKNKKKVNKKKKNITNNYNKKSLCLSDIFVLDEIFLKDSKQIINMEVEDIVEEISIDLLNNKILLNNLYNNTDSEIISLNDIDNKNVYKEILEELDKYKKNVNQTSYVDIPLNEWGKWIYI